MAEKISICTGGLFVPICIEAEGMHYVPKLHILESWKTFKLWLVDMLVELGAGADSIPGAIEYAKTFWKEHDA